MVTIMNRKIGVGGKRGIRLGLLRRGLLGGLVLLLLLGACRAKEQGPEPETPVATVNGEAISRASFLEALDDEFALAKDSQRVTGEEMETLKAEVLATLIEERLILQRARALGLSLGATELEARIDEIRKDYSEEGFKALFGKGSIDFKTWQDSLRRRLLIEKVVAADVNAAITLDEAEAERLYRADPKAYASQERLRAQQIVVHERDQAEAILKRLKAGEDFGKVAREVSIGPEGAKGGDLGFVERGVMPEVIDQVLFSLGVGTLSRVVESPYGFHIFKVLGREEQGGKNFAEAKARVLADLRKKKEAEAYERWLEGLKSKAQIEIRRPLPDLAVSQAPGPALPPGGPEKNE